MAREPLDELRAAGPSDEPTIDEFYERASCGYASMASDGVLVRVNETFVGWTGRPRDALLSGTRFAELLTVGSRLYYETHCAPMLAAGLELREVALDLRRADGSIVLALVGATVHPGEGGKNAVVRLTIFDASHRRGFERHLLAERDADRQAREYAEALGRIADRLALLETPNQIGAALGGELVGGGFASSAELIARGAGPHPTEATFARGPHGEGTVGQIPVMGADGSALGALRIACDAQPSDANVEFLQSAAELAGRALGRVQRTAAVARAARKGGSVGLPNERWWSAELKAELRRAAVGSPLTVVVVEISQLDQVTLTQGMGAADALLLAISDAWREAGFDLLSRFGGEEFAVLMPGLKAAEAKVAVALARRSAGARRHFTVGIAEWDGEESALSLMSRAEAALPAER